MVRHIVSSVYTVNLRNTHHTSHKLQHYVINVSRLLISISSRFNWCWKCHGHVIHIVSWQEMGVRSGHLCGEVASFSLSTASLCVCKWGKCRQVTTLLKHWTYSWKHYKWCSNISNPNNFLVDYVLDIHHYASINTDCNTPMLPNCIIFKFILVFKFYTKMEQKDDK